MDDIQQPPLDPTLDPLEAAKRAVDQRRAAKRQPGTVSPFLCGTDIPLEAPEHLWTERMPLGEVNLIDGEPSEGKSTLLIGLMARLTSGERLPFDGVERRPCTVIWYGPEENTRKAAMPRFVAAGGERSRFFEFKRVPGVPAFSLPSNERYIDDQIASLRAQGHDVKLVAIDGLSVIMDPTGPGDRPLSENSAADVQLVLDALLRISRKHNIVIFGLRHLGKSSAQSSLNNRGLGSKKWEGLARAHWIVMPHPEDHALKILVPLKHPYSTPFPTTIVYRIVGKDVVMSNGATRNYGLVDFVREDPAITKHTLGMAHKPARVTKAEEEDACAAIGKLLREENRPLTDTEIADVLSEQGHTKDALERATFKLLRTGQASSFKAGDKRGLKPLGMRGDGRDYTRGDIQSRRPDPDDGVPF